MISFQTLFFAPTRFCCLLYCLSSGLISPLPSHMRTFWFMVCIGRCWLNCYTRIWMNTFMLDLNCFFKMWSCFSLHPLSSRTSKHLPGWNSLQVMLRQQKCFMLWDTTPRDWTYYIWRESQGGKTQWTWPLMQGWGYLVGWLFFVIHRTIDCIARRVYISDEVM